MIAIQKNSDILLNGRSSWRRDAVIICVLFATSFYLYSHFIWRPQSPDEQNYLAWSMQIYREGVYATAEGRLVTWTPPLHTHLMALSYHLFGPSTSAAQAVSVLFGCLCIVAVYCFGRSLWNWRVGVIAALLLLTAAKGEFWRYSNRVLIEIHLTLFVIVTLLGLCLYYRHGRWWMAALAGGGLGIGLLTKEYTILLLPLFVPAFFLSRGRFLKNAVAFGLALLLAAMLVWPWVSHVKSHTGLYWGRGKGKAVKTIQMRSSYGLRPAEEIVQMVTFYDRPAWIAQVAYLAAFLYGAWRFGRRRSIEGLMVMAAVLIWFSGFAVYKNHPLSLRRLIPMLPLFSILVAVLFEDIWSKRQVVSRFFRERRGWTYYGLVLVFIVFLVNNLKPQKALKGFEPFSVLTSKTPPYLKEPIKGALSCVPKDSVILTNYASLAYFYSRGEASVRKMRLTKDPRKRIKRRMRKIASPKIRLDSDSLIYDFHLKGRRFVMDERGMLEQIEASNASHVIFLRNNNPRKSPPALEKYFQSHPERLQPECVERDYTVYRIMG